VAIVIAVIMFAGFSRNYYLRAWMGTRDITLMVQIHGMIMTSWVLVFVIQALLIAKHRVDLHRRLGIVGAALAAVVVTLGIATIADSIERQQPQASVKLFGQLFVAFDGVMLLVFACLTLAALINRQRPETHKRLMLVAMISLLPPAWGRLVANITHQNIELIVLGLMYISVLSCLFADTWRYRRLNLAFALAGSALIAANQLTYFAQINAP